MWKHGVLAHAAVSAIAVLAIQVLSVSAVALGEGQTGADTSKKILATVYDQLALSRVSRVAVFLTGGEPANTKVLEDALAIELEDMGWHVVSRLALEKKVTRDWEQWIYLPDSLKADTAKVMSEMEIARLVKTDAFVTGTVLFGRRQSADVGKQSSTSLEKAFITALSFQIVDVAQERVSFSGVIDYIDGKSALHAAEDVRLLLQQHIKK